MKMKRWEIALLASLLAVMMMFAVPSAAQDRLADKMVRLHVVANSDSTEDQALKLLARDAALAAAEGAEEIDALLLDDIRTAVAGTLARAGCVMPVCVERRRMWFDTRVYETFALPAGMYDAVRVTIGEGRGHNWWCVLFPPLCAGACEQDVEKIAASAGLTKDEAALICGEDGYILRFKLMDWCGKLRGMLTGCGK